MTLLGRQERFPGITFLLFMQLLQQILISYHQGPLTLMEKSNCLLQSFQLSQLLGQASHLYGQLLVFAQKLIVCV